MTEPATTARLERLERSHRRLQRATLVLGLLLTAAVLVAATPTVPATRTLELNSLKLVDAAGKVRVLLTATAGVSLLDPTGRPRAVLSSDAQGPGLILYGERGKGRAIFNVNADGPALTFTGPGGALRAVFALLDRGPGLVLFDEQQNERVALTVRRGAGALELTDAGGRPRRR